MLPKYTFLLPAYKSDFLYHALRSIQQQTYKDFLVIISDDCSPENLDQIVEPFLKDSRFTYCRNKENIGSVNLVKHWNLLLSKCKTEYLIMASDDDIYDTCFLEEIDSLQKRFPKTNVFRSRTNRINGDNKVLIDDYSYPAKSEQLRFLYDMFTTMFIHCIGNYVFNTEELKHIGGFIDFPLAWFSDDATVIALSENGVCNTSKTLFSFRTSGKNISSESNKSNKNHKYKINATEKFYDWMVDFKDREIGSQLSTLEEEYTNRVFYELKKRILSQIILHVKNLNLIEKIRIYHWLKRRHIFTEAHEKFRYIYSCI